MKPEAPTLDEIREWLLDVRDRNKLSQADVDRLTREMGDRYRISQGYLSLLERGVKQISDLSAERMDALRRVYKLTPEEWVEKTGLSIVTRENLGERKHLTLTATAEPRKFPPGLQEAIEKYGDTLVPEFKDPEWIKSLIDLKMRGSGPETADEWAEYVLFVRKYVRPPRK